MLTITSPIVTAITVVTFFTTIVFHFKNLQVKDFRFEVPDFGYCLQNPQSSFNWVKHGPDLHGNPHNY